ncbi:ribulose-phosphate 3-epimerase [Pseudonocardia acidicola]|uniref:Ribulose-phosphate 3-epimerase n=1 Tax=Pseudonocardia acidicola TaxID=2724939 RepID=A0ABX1S8Y1_9PSEU|nr:ribulose-phosphate 3-epimerase [Pseudonocardia acidicola]NMH97032.1 ribulose-phosphate 3-epimerase [Pseudonocardia acidicola]
MPGYQEPTLVASVLSTDVHDLGGLLLELERSGVDRVHWDVQDGRSGPHPAFGPELVAAARGRVDLDFEVHLMVDDPDPVLADWACAGCSIVIVHAEAHRHLHRTLFAVAELGARVGVALGPATPLCAVDHVLDMIDLLLIMTADPGPGGQPYLASVQSTITAARAEIDRRGLDVALEVDGGIDPVTIGAAAAAGADVFCAGPGLLYGPGTMADRVAELRGAAAAARDLRLPVGAG